jgi:hypothetical protein
VTDNETGVSQAQHRDDASWLDTPDPGVAGAQVAAEEERFDGLVNEPGNPPRQPGLQQSGEEDPVDE